MGRFLYLCRPYATRVPFNFDAGVWDLWVGSDFSCALLMDGQVFCWGSNSNAQLGNGTRTQPSDGFQSVTPPLPTTGAFTGVASSLYATCLRKNWETWCWGASSEKGELAPILSPSLVTFEKLPLKLYSGF
jgi:hypothetical protein